MIGLVTTAVQRRATSATEIRRELEDRRRHPYRELLGAVLADVAAGAESPIELDYLREIERPHGLPVGDRQQSRRGLPYCTDVLYEEFGTIAELDGRAAHRGMAAFRDMRRDNRFLLTTGWITLRYGWDDLVARPCAVGYQVWYALTQRGYNRPFERCRNCAGVPEAELAVA